MKDNVKNRENQEKSDRRVSNEQRIVWNLPIGKQALFPGSEPRKICEKQEDFYENRSYEETAADCHRNGPAGSYRRITIIPICGSQLIAVPLRIRHFMPHMPKEKLR